jgi:hypothetical protein
MNIPLTIQFLNLEHFLNLSTIDIWDFLFYFYALLWWAVLCTIGCLASPLVSNVHTLRPQCDNQNISRQCQMSSGSQDHSQLRITRSWNDGFFSPSLSLSILFIYFLTSLKLYMSNSIPLILWNVTCSNSFSSWVEIMFSKSACDSL